MEKSVDSDLAEFKKKKKLIEKLWFGEYLGSDEKDYYKNWIIGTVKKDDGKYLRLKQYIRPENNDCLYGQCISKIQQEIKSYLDDLASGEMTSAYFDR